MATAMFVFVIIVLFVRYEKSPTAVKAVGDLCLDIEIYIEALEAVHTAGFGDGVQVLFCILNGHCEASKQLVIT